MAECQVCVGGTYRVSSSGGGLESHFIIFNLILMNDISVTIEMCVESVSVLSNSEADSGLVKLVAMTNVFFNNQQHEIKTRQCIFMKQKKPSFFSNNGNQLFYSRICKT